MNLPKLLTRDTLDKLMFGFVLGARHRNAIPVIEVKKSLEAFQKEFNLSEDDYPLDSAKTTFYNMYKEYCEFIKE